MWLDSHSFDSMTVFIHHGSISIRVNVRLCIVIVCVVTVVVKGSFETAAVAATVALTIAAARRGVVGVSVPKVILCGCEWVGIVGVGL